ncbi:MAG: transporter [Bacteroidetes bacterium]|nr:transporter [Bacteroidota bacterium]
MRVSVLVLIAWLGAVGPDAAHAQDPPLVSDRPGQTMLPALAPAHTAQVETGIVAARQATSTTSTLILRYPTTVLRVGLLPTFELRVTGEFLDQTATVDSSGSETTRRGVHGIAVGCKSFIAKERGPRPEMAIAFMLALPIGTQGLYAKYPAPSVTFAMKKGVAPGAWICYNVGGSWNGNNAIPGISYSAHLNVSPEPGLNAFAEIYGNVDPTSHPLHGIDAGLSLLTTQTLQADLTAGIRISPFGPDYFLGTGLTWRFAE